MIDPRGFTYILVAVGLLMLAALGVAVIEEVRDRRRKRKEESERRVREQVERHVKPMAIQVLPHMPTKPFEGGLTHNERALLRLVNTRSEWDDGSDDCA